jgi:hypothetical protein
MPTYRTRQGTAASKKRKKKRNYPKRLPRDPKKLFRWAARGSGTDYEKLRNLAKKARAGLPVHIDSEAFDRITRVDRSLMIEEIQAAEEHNVSAGFFLDAVNWLLDKVPWGNWNWVVSAAQGGINAQKGDGLNEVDEQYARLVGATYGSVADRPYVLDHWERQVQFDSDYVSVWDNRDGHRLVAVRGTQGAGDILEDIAVGVSGHSTDAIGAEILQILASTPQGTVVDLAAHSLGTSLALQAYGNDTIYNGIHETYLYNPAYSPFVRGSADAFERDSNVRYFINTLDPVSMGSFGHRAPSNVVFRSGDGIDVVGAHKLAQWQGASSYVPPTYHSPPETRIHAHKAVFSKTKVEHDTYDVGNRERVDALPAPELAQPVEFDFGDVPEFDYGTLE